MKLLAIVAACVLVGLAVGGIWASAQPDDSLVAVVFDPPVG